MSNQERKRGKAFKTLLLESIRDNTLLEVGHGATKEEVEQAYVTHIAQRAFDASDKDSIVLLRETLNKSYAGLKATMPVVEFELPDDSSPLQKAEAILKAVSTGDIAPDIGTMLIQAAKHVIDIEETTELKERLDAIEKELGIGQ